MIELSSVEDKLYWLLKNFKDARADNNCLLVRWLTEAEDIKLSEKDIEKIKNMPAISSLIRERTRMKNEKHLFAPEKPIDRNIRKLNKFF